MPDNENRKEYFERRARSLGLPTDPEAYRGGGLVPATSAYSLQEADLIAAELSSAGIPAWVEGGATASWYWFMQFGLHAGGIRILVPARRLADAQALLRSHSPGAEASQPPAEPTEEPAPLAPDLGPPEVKGGDYLLRRSAERQATLLIVGIFAPVVFVLALRLLLKIRRWRAEHGVTPDLARARLIALAMAFLGCPMWGFFLGVIALRIAHTMRLVQAP